MADGLVKDADGRAFVANDSGKLFKVDPAEAEKLVAEGRYKAASLEQVSRRTAERNSTALGAAARGAASGVVGGAIALPKVITSLTSAVAGTEDPLADITGRSTVEDAAAIAAHVTGGESEVAGRQMGEAIRADLTANPTAFMAGEIAGGLAGSGALAKGATGLAVRGVQLAGLTGRAATVARMGAAGALEGAVLGGEMAHEDAWVRNERATASQTLAGMGMGALFGGVIGTGAGRLATRTRKGPSVAALVGDDVTEAGTVLGGAEAQAGRSGLEEAAEKARGGWRGRAAAYMDEEAIAAISRQNKGAVRELGDRARAAKVGSILNELDITGARKSGGMIGRSAEEMLDIAKPMRQKIGAELSADLGRVSDKIGAVAADELFKVADDVIAKLDSGALLGPQRAAVAKVRRVLKPWRDSFEMADGSLRQTTLKEAHAVRMQLDDLVNFAKREPSMADKSVKDLRRGFQTWIEKQVSRVGDELGDPELLAKYRRTNDEYGAIAWADDTLTERVRGDIANRRFGLTDSLGAVTGASIGSGFGAVPGLLTAGAIGLGNKFFRERGSTTVIALGRKILGDVVDSGLAPARYRAEASAVGDVVQGVQSHVDEQIGNFLGGDGPALLPPGPSPRGSKRGGGGMSPPPSSAAAIRAGGAKAYKQHAQEVVNVATNADEAMRRMEQHIGPSMAAASPRLFQAMAAVTIRASQYLSANMPVPPTDPESIMPHLDDPPPVSDRDLHAYADRVEGVESPMTLLDDLNRGHVSPEKLEAVKAVHPEMLDMMRQLVFARLADRTTPLSNSQRTMLDIALDANGAIDPSMRSGHLAVMREVAGMLAKQAQKKPQRGPMPSASASLAPRSQQIAMR